LAETGAGWVPALLDRLEYMGDHAGYMTSGGWTHPKLKPAEVLLTNFAFSVFDDKAALAMRDRIGVDKILLEVDYPHGDGTWPDSQAFVLRLLRGCSEQEVRKMTHANAAALLRHPLPDHRPITTSD
jgi:Amidohydrolase